MNAPKRSLDLQADHFHYERKKNYYNNVQYTSAIGGSMSVQSENGQIALGNKSSHVLLHHWLEPNTPRIAFNSRN